MEIFENTKQYHVLGAKLLCPPPKIVNVHLKSHTAFETCLTDELSPLKFNQMRSLPNAGSEKFSPDAQISHGFTCSDTAAAGKKTLQSIEPISDVSIDYSINSRQSFDSPSSAEKQITRDLAFQLAFPRAMRNVFMPARRTSVSSSAAVENSCSIKSEGAGSATNACTLYSAGKSVRKRKGSWNISPGSISDFNVNIDSENVWPRGRFHSITEKGYVPLFQSKFQAVWNEIHTTVSVNTSTSDKASEKLPRKTYENSHQQVMSK